MAAFIIPESAAEQLRKVARGGCDMPSIQPPLWLEDVARAVSAAADWDFDAPARQFARALPDLGRRDDSAGRRSAVAALVMSLPERIASIDLPASVISLYPAAVSRLAGDLQSHDAYDPDHFAKDVRFALGLTVPVGGQIADIAYSAAPSAAMGRVRRALANGGRLAATGDLRGLGVFLAAGPFRPYVQLHTEARDLSNFSPDGWDRAYARVADMLQNRPDFGGLLGLSWFYDPQVAQISPRLAYLAERQIQNGGVRIRLGASPLQIELATSRSESRRRLYEEGRFKPRCYAIVWPRASLIAWAQAAQPLASAPERPGRAA